MIKIYKIRDKKLEMMNRTSYCYGSSVTSRTMCYVTTPLMDVKPGTRVEVLHSMTETITLDKALFGYHHTFEVQYEGKGSFLMGRETKVIEQVVIPDWVGKTLEQAIAHARAEKIAELEQSIVRSRTTMENNIKEAKAKIKAIRTIK